MWAKWILVSLVVVLAGAVAGFLAFAWEPAIAPTAAPRAESFDPALIRRGAALAALGDCNSCHTAPGGEAFAGGLALRTPFGTIYSTNITPDPETGIGQWSLSAFRRAMRQGVDREGRHLYPAFPYDHFTLVTDEDNEALSAFLMTRRPVPARAPADRLDFPMNIRLLLAGWKLLFLRQGPYVPDARHDEAWNRGAYLAEGLGHCGACHTPRNWLGAERASQRFAGGEAEDWHAPALEVASPSPVPWDEDALYAYLRQGWHELHGVALGPMAPVSGNMASVPDADLRAIALYLASLAGAPSPERLRHGEALAADARLAGPGGRPQSGGSQTAPGGGVPAANGADAAIYASACASRHESGRPLPFGGVSLALSTVVSDTTATNLVNIVFDGIPASGDARGIMPGFSGVLSDREFALLAAYLRSRFSDRPAWTDLAATIQARRSAQRSTAARISEGAVPRLAATSP